MRLEKKIGKKIATLALAAAMAVGGSLSVFAATGFTVSAPSLAYLNGGYVVSGGMSYSSSTSSTSYYLLVEVTGLARVNGKNKLYEASGYGYGAASAMTETIPTRPSYIENRGSYNTGSGFREVDVKYVNNP